ncbi:MAG: phage major capsid protein [Bacteroidales bacterium]|nr:phage major capsid protein [Bacteroidales bacterium]MBR1436133.1 phage major capsid protein [Bacteroidales bacterium]
MKKNQINVRQLVNQYQANCDRISEIADACEKEQRERTEAENKEFEALSRENQLISMRMQAATAEHLRENPNAREEAVRMIRENASKGRKTEITFMREGEFTGMMVSDIESGAIVPLNVQDIIKPLQEGFILDKVGLPMPTGLAGDYVWPTYDMVEATVAGEGVALSDTKIEFNKLTANPERIGIAIPVTNQSLNQSAGVLEMIIREVMPLSIRQLLNKILFSPTVVNNATNLVGPIAKILQVAAKSAASRSKEEKKYNAVVTLSTVPTFIELNKNMKAAVLETGIEGNHLCWIMTKSMQAVLEGTPINSEGIYVPMIQDGKLCGLPVYTTNVIRDTSGNTPVEYIALGDFGYQPMGLFGTLRFIVDPYSMSRKDSVDFVLNTDYGTKTLRPEAFILGRVSSGS